MPESTPRRTEPPRRGRPPTNSADELARAALQLFAEHGYEGTTVDMIAAATGASRRTFFRYFESKASVLWREFDHEVTALRDTLATMPVDLPVMDAIRKSVVSVNHYRAADVDELRTRMGLIGSVPELSASASVHYDAWERAIADYVGRRGGVAADSLYPLAVSRATLATCRAAFDCWTARADADLTVYLDTALSALAAGFAEHTRFAEPGFTAPSGTGSGARR